MSEHDRGNLRDERRLKQQARLEEYRALREEQMYALRSRVWGLAAYAGISGGVFAFARDADKSCAGLAVIFLAIPIVYYTSYVVRASVRIGAYIKVILEEAVPGLWWEHGLIGWRRHVEKGDWESGFARWRYLFSILGVYDIVVLYSLYFIFASEAPVWQRLLGCVGVGVIAHSHLRLGKILGSGEAYRGFFESVREQGKVG